MAIGTIGTNQEESRWSRWTRDAYVRSALQCTPPRKIARPGSRVLVREAAVSDEEGALEAGGVVTRRAAGKRPSETHVCYQPGLSEPYTA